MNIRVTIVERDASSIREGGTPWHDGFGVEGLVRGLSRRARTFLYPLLHSTNTGVGGNVSFYKNTTFDSIVSAARREQNSGKRAQLYLNADSIAFHDAPMIFFSFSIRELDAIQPLITRVLWSRRFSMDNAGKTVSIVHATPKAH